MKKQRIHFIPLERSFESVKQRLRGIQFTKGFTLLELLIYMGLFTVLISILAGVFTAVLNVQLESQAVSSVQQDGRYILSKLSYDLHQVQNSSDVTTPATIGQTSSSLQITINSTNYLYAVDGSGNLTITSGGSTDQINSYDTNISGFSVTRLGSSGNNPTFRIQFTITSRVEKNSGYETQSFDTTLGIR